MQAPRIDTEHLLLKAPEIQDAPAMYAYRSDPAVNRYQSWRPGGVQEVEQFIRNLAQTGFNRVDWCQHMCYHEIQ